MADTRSKGFDNTKIDLKNMDDIKAISATLS